VKQRLAAGLAVGAALALLFTLRVRDPGFLPGHHGYNSTLALALAKNLGPTHGFLMFSRAHLDAAGRVQLDPHNRLPIPAFLLIRAAMLPCGGDVLCEIAAARLLMILLLGGAMVVSYLLMVEISGRPLLAAAVAILAFSSYYLQYYGDMIYNDIPALFGFLLILLGIARYERDGARGILYAGVAIGVGFGWQAFGALAAWWVVDFVGSVRRASGGASSTLRGLIRREPTRALGAALLFGALLLAFNLLNEWRVLGGNLTSLPSVRSILFRTGVASEEAGAAEASEIRWTRFLTKQARRVMKASLPAGAMHDAVSKLGNAADARPFLVLAAALAGAALLVWRFMRVRGNRVVLGTVLLSGFFWTIPLKNFSAFHEYQSFFYVGFALVFYYALLDRTSGWPTWVVLPAALVLFAWSCVALRAEKANLARPFNTRSVDFAAIRAALGPGRKVLLGAEPDEFAGEGKALRYFLAGEYEAPAELAEFVITRRRDYGREPMTPANREVFLFRTRP
jgi:hypothetical protein